MQHQNIGKPQLVMIEWEDAFGSAQGWVTLSDYEPLPAHPITVGWLLPDILEGYITTADTYLDSLGEDEPQFYNVGHIPKGMIKSITPIKMPAKLSKPLRKKGV